MLRVALSALREDAVKTVGHFPADHPMFGEVDFALAKPVSIEGSLRAAGPGRYYWQARITTDLRSACRRCLAPVVVPIGASVEALFTHDASGDDDPAAYVIEPDAEVVDVADAVREELILAAPQYLVCRESCRGLCAGCGSDLNVTSCTCAPEPDPRWEALEVLRPRGAG